MVDIVIKSFKPSFNRLDFIKYLFEKTDNSLIESKLLLDKLIAGNKIEVKVSKESSKTFIDELLSLGVFGEIKI
ncbi:hypothetical protein [Leeuwenhoekiella sp. H156]|uniref:hypothetical protein n=1 Tax=Leeuwenhoekiella sp. H156 TaxID=3450128 RepID=UPI003FA44417